MGTGEEPSIDEASCQFYLFIKTLFNESIELLIRASDLKIPSHYNWDRRRLRVRERETEKPRESLSRREWERERERESRLAGLMMMMMIIWKTKKPHSKQLWKVFGELVKKVTAHWGPALSSHWTSLPSNNLRMSPI